MREETKMAKQRKVRHLSVVIRLRDYTRYTTACGRSRITDDGMNIADMHTEVTCKFCLALLKKGTQYT